MRIKRKKFIYLISPTKITKLFYQDLIEILEQKKVSFFQLRLKKESLKKETKSSKTLQEKDREKLEEKFSDKKKETIN